MASQVKQLRMYSTEDHVVNHSMQDMQTLYIYCTTMISDSDIQIK